MKQRLASAVGSLLISLLVCSPPPIGARDVPPIVDTAWVQKNLENPKVAVLDIRKVEEYKEGHIPNSFNVFYGSWVVGKDELRNQLPAKDDLFDTIGSAVISGETTVVVVGKVDKMPERTDISRVAWTLKYAGIENVAILDGGYNKWVSEGKQVSKEMVKAYSKPYEGKVKPQLFADKGYVQSRLGKAVIVDVREAEFFQGKKKMDFVAKMGRIPGAVHLPNSLMFKEDGTLKPKEELASAAAKAVGDKLDSEIIVYCDTGKVGTFWAILLTDLLGYKDVKVYDGSMEEWTKDPQAPLEM